MNNIKEQVQKIDSMVSQGAMIDAVNTFFSENAKTNDTGGIETLSRSQMIEKMNAFLGAIQKVNGITHHYSIVTDNVSASEFTFDFDMKDGSRILWHEIIRRVWNEEGKIVNEQYFKS